MGIHKKKWVYHDKEYTIDELLKLAKCSEPTFYRRLRLGWSLEQIINNKPVHHHMKDTRLYRIYYCMINRCYNKNDEYHKKHYQDKCITICDEWLDDNKTFFDWAIKNGYQDNLTIDRIDNNKGYSPSNCRWVTTYEQNKNRTCSLLVMYDGKTKSINEWISKLGLKVSYRNIHNRLANLGWTVEEAFYTENHSYKGKEKIIENKLRKWLADNGIYALGVLKQKKTIRDIGYHQKVFNGGFMSTSGIPDLSITIHGVDIQIECKKEDGLPSIQQKRILEQILNSGGYGFILKPSNYNDVICFLKAIIEHDEITKNAMYQVLASQTYCMINGKTRR